MISRPDPPRAVLQVEIKGPNPFFLVAPPPPSRSSPGAVVPALVSTEERSPLDQAWK